MAEVPAPLAHRVARWIEEGIGADELLAACREVPPAQGPGTPAWVAAFSGPGDRHVRSARDVEVAGDRDRVRDEYLTAAFYYFLARFPHIFSPAAREAYLKHIAAYLHAGSYFDPPLEVIRLPFEGKELVGYLRVPKSRGDHRPPVVILSGGIDVWKSDSELHHVGEAMLAEGLAACSIDMPGTGEGPLLVAPGAERSFAAMIDHLRARDDVDGERIGFYGMSFGGHWAVRLACGDYGLRAVVNVGGPVHHTFVPEWCERIPVGTLVTLAVTLGEDFRALGPRGVAARLSELSLVERGLLRPREDVPALLSINGAHDELVTIDDLRVISERGIAQDTLIFANDRHVASQNAAVHIPFAARWLQRHLSA